MSQRRGAQPRTSQRDKVAAAVQRLRRPTDVDCGEIWARILRILAAAADAQLVVSCRFVEHDGVVHFHAFRCEGPPGAEQQFRRLNDTPVPRFVRRNLRRPKPRERNRFMHVGPHRQGWEQIKEHPDYQAFYGHWQLSDMLQLNLYDERHCLGWISVCRTGSRPGYSSRLTRVLSPLVEPIGSAIRRADSLEREAGLRGESYVVRESAPDRLVGCENGQAWMGQSQERAEALSRGLHTHADDDGFLLGGSFVRVRRLAGPARASVLGHVTPLPFARWSPEANLSPRQRHAARQAADGLSVKEIASEMGVSPDTIRGYLQEAYRRLGVSNRAELTRALRDVAPG